MRSLAIFLLGFGAAQVGSLYAALNRQNHVNLNEVSQELDHLDDMKQDGITFSTRAPNTADKTGRLWITYTANSDTTITMYIRHPVSGVWRSEAFN